MKKQKVFSNFLVRLKSFIKKNEIVFIIALSSLLFSSCATNRSVSIPVPTNLISNERLSKPIVENAVKIIANENPQIQSVYKIEESIKSALRTSLDLSNIFGRDSSKPFKIVIKILEFNQPAGSFGMFDTTLKTHYVIFDDENNIFFEEDITTEGWSDTWYFAGAKRAQRAATICVANNVKQFVDILKSRFKKSNDESANEMIFEPNDQHYPNRKSEINNKSSLSTPPVSG